MTNDDEDHGPRYRGGEGAMVHPRERHRLLDRIKRCAVWVFVGTLACSDGPTDPPSAEGPGTGTPIVIRDQGRSMAGRLHTLRLPLIYEAGSADSLDLSFVHLPSTSTDPGDPILFLAGGPGNALIDRVRGDRFEHISALLASGDVVLVDQRGTGRSGPDSFCTGAFALDLLETDWTLLAEQMATQFGVCVASSGIDPAAFTTVQSARDLEVVRTFLEAPSVVLVGYSYGTHLALAFARAFPDRVSSLALHGVEGPDHTLKLPSNGQAQLEAVAEQVAADARLASEIPDFVGLVDSLITTLDHAPLIVSVGGQEVAVDGQGVRIAVANLMSTREDIAFLVSAVEAARADDWTAFAVALIAIKTLPKPSIMSIAMDCASGASDDRRARISAETPRYLLGDALNFPFPAICQGVGMRTLPSAFRAPITSDARALLVSGTLDGRTPVSNAQEVAAGFSSPSLVIIERAGHDALDPEVAGLMELVTEFLNGQPLGERSLTLPPIVFPPL